MVLTVLFMLAVSSTVAARFVVDNVALRLVEDVYLLDADIELQLTDEVIEALENGVAITVVFETDVVRERRFAWNETVADIEASYAIEYQSLSGQYVVRNLELGLSRGYRRLAPLLADLGQLRDFPLLGASRLQTGERYTVRVRARLDIESLPAPLRPLAYLSSLWRLRSDWYEWPVTP